VRQQRADEAFAVGGQRIGEDERFLPAGRRRCRQCVGNGETGEHFGQAGLHLGGAPRARRERGLWPDGKRVRRSIPATVDGRRTLRPIALRAPAARRRRTAGLRQT